MPKSKNMWNKNFSNLSKNSCNSESPRDSNYKREETNNERRQKRKINHENRMKYEHCNNLLKIIHNYHKMVRQSINHIDFQTRTLLMLQIENLEKAMKRKSKSNFNTDTNNDEFESCNSICKKVHQYGIH